MYQTGHRLAADVVDCPAGERHQLRVGLWQVGHGADQPVRADARVQHRRNVPRVVVRPAEPYTVRWVRLDLALHQQRVHVQRTDGRLLRTGLAAGRICRSSGAASPIEEMGRD